MKKKIFFLIVLTLFLVLVFMRQNSADVPMPELESAMLSETDISQTMRKSGDLDLMHFMNISPSETVEYVYYRGTGALSVDEFLIVRTRGHNELGPFRDAVEARIDEQIGTFEGYGPEQVAALKSALIVEKGPYILYSVGPSPEKIEEVFTHAL